MADDWLQQTDKTTDGWTEKQIKIAILSKIQGGYHC
jgi:hypothetical protein